MVNGHISEELGIMIMKICIRFSLHPRIFGYSYIDEIYGDVNKLSKETLARYFDFESFGHELSFDYFIDDKLNIAISNN